MVDIAKIPQTIGVGVGGSYEIYNVDIDATNFERGYMRWNANVLEFGTEAGGTGILRKVRLKSLLGILEFEDANGWISRSPLNNTMQFAPSDNLAALSLTAAGLFPGPSATNFGVRGLAAATIGVTGTLTVGPADRGGNTGDGHNLLLTAGSGSTAGAGTKGGTSTLAGADAKGTGNNNGGDAIMQGGLPTGTGLPGVSKVDYMKPKTLPLVADLRPASAALEGAKAHVTDATTRVFGDIVVGGGALSVPVHCDGTAWRIG